MKTGKRTHDALRLTTGAAVALVLAACGGGGSGDSGAQNGGGTSAAITPDNAAQVAGATYWMGDLLYSTAGDAAQTIDPKSSDATTPRARPGLAQFALRKFLGLESGTAENSRLSGKAIQTYADACALGGSFTETWNDADNNGVLSTGDTASLTFRECEEEPGLRIDGTIALSNVVMTGTSATPARSVGATFTYHSLRFTFDDESVTVDGDMSLQAAITNYAPFTYDFSVNGKSLVAQSGARHEALSGYDANIYIDYTAGTYAYAVGGTVSGSSMPTAITMTTPKAFAGNIGAFPVTGMTVATATDGTAARLTVNSATNVTVDLDADADGVFESSEQMTWAQLTAL